MTREIFQSENKFTIHYATAHRSPEKRCEAAIEDDRMDFNALLSRPEEELRRLSKSEASEIVCREVCGGAEQTFPRGASAPGAVALAAVKKETRDATRGSRRLTESLLLLPSTLRRANEESSAAQAVATRAERARPPLQTLRPQTLQHVVSPAENEHR